MVRDASSNVTASVIRSLNADFVRKGIVVNAAEDFVPNASVDPRLGRLLESLQRSCRGVGTDTSEINAAIQLWKERSLHHALQTIDQLQTLIPGSGERGHERQILAIEMHEKGGREIRDAVLRAIQAIVDTMLHHIETFSRQVTKLIHELVKPELEDELIKERRVIEKLIEEKQRLTHDRITLEESNSQLTERIASLENSPDGGGDAILCRKLRHQVRQLQEQNREMQDKIQEIEQEQAKWRWDMTQIRAELEMQQKTLTITKAMHEKETKQLVDLIHTRESRFQQVVSANLHAVAQTRDGIESYDPHSGHKILHVSPQKPSSTPVANPTKTKTVLVHLPPGSLSPSSPKRRHIVHSPASPSATSFNQTDRAAKPASPAPIGSVRRLHSG